MVGNTSDVILMEPWRLKDLTGRKRPFCFNARSFSRCRSIRMTECGNVAKKMSCAFSIHNTQLTIAPHFARPSITSASLK
jgi:hypothetical protein